MKTLLSIDTIFFSLIDQNFDIVQKFIVSPVFEYQQGHYFYYVIG